MAAPVSDLPAPLSPTTPSTSPGSMAKETPSSARSMPRRVGKLDDQVADVQQTGHQRSLGFSASRSQSPSRLIDSTISTRAAPGKTVTHHWPL